MTASFERHPPETEPAPRRAVAFTHALLGVGAAIALARALSSSWLCDDAFICFRYAQQLLAGHGPVFNVGERVEGVTDPLWTLWIAAGMGLGATPERWVQVWGLIAFGATLVVLGRAHLRARRELNTRGLTLPFAVLALAAHTEACVFATSGLETAAFSCLVLGSLVVLPLEAAPSPKRAAAAGALLGAAALCRHDGLLFAPIAGAFLLLSGTRGLRAALSFSAALLAMWSPLTLARLLYYGDLLPNTYYAKSGGTPWIGQGLTYLSLYLQRYAPLALAPLVAASALLRSDMLTSELRRRIALGLVAALAYAAYVVRVGGDFMFGRMLLPATLPLLLATDLALLGLAQRWQKLSWAAAGLAILLLGVLPSPVSGRHWIAGIADERAFYDAERNAHLDAQAAAVAPLMRDLPLKVVFWGGEARFIYRSGAPIAIEAEAGLTDRYIAHLPLARRGRPGHEKVPPPSYLVTTRQADLAFELAKRATPALDAYIPTVHVRFGPAKARLLHWDADLVEKLRARGAKVQDFPAALDRYIAGLAQLPPAIVRADYVRFQHFYFAFNHDPTREQALLARLQQ